MISPSDPVFWPFHTGFDRQWAKWQWLGGHIQPDGSQESYFPRDAFDPTAPGCDVADPSGCTALGHHLRDTMWPWDGRVGQDPVAKASRPPANFSQGLLGPVPKPSIAGLWPAAPTAPTPGDTIDLAGVTQGRLDMGFAYDDVPYGVRPALVVASVPRTGELAAAGNSEAQLVKPQHPGSAETAAAGGEMAEPSNMLAIATDPSRPATDRIEALRDIAERNDGSVTAPAMQILQEGGAGTALRVTALNALGVQMVFGAIDEKTHHEIMAALRQALSDDDLEVRRSALRVLVSNRDPAAVELLAEGLQDPSSSKFTAMDAIQGIQIAGAAPTQAAILRPYLASEDPSLRTAAVTALGSDKASRPSIESLLRDTQQPYEVRSAALRSLATTDQEGAKLLMDVLERPNENPRLRQQAATALTTTIQSSGAEFSKGELDNLTDKLRGLRDDRSLAPALDRALKATESVRTDQ
jgi:hypothetical protein